MGTFSKPPDEKLFLLLFHNSQTSKSLIQVLDLIFLNFLFTQTQLTLIYDQKDKELVIQTNEFLKIKKNFSNKNLFLPILLPYNTSNKTEPPIFQKTKNPLRRVVKLLTVTPFFFTYYINKTTKLLPVMLCLQL
jgi:hypothetical protein